MALMFSHSTVSQRIRMKCNTFIQSLFCFGIDSICWLLLEIDLIDILISFKYNIYIRCSQSDYSFERALSLHLVVIHYTITKFKLKSMYCNPYVDLTALMLSIKLCKLFVVFWITDMFTFNKPVIAISGMQLLYACQLPNVIMFGLYKRRVGDWASAKDVGSIEAVIWLNICSVLSVPFCEYSCDINDN